MQNPFKRENLYCEFMTLHLNIKDNKKSIIIKKIHVYSICVLAILFGIGSLYSYSSYRIAKEKLAASSKQLEEIIESKAQIEKKAKQLEVENEEYNKSINKIEEKANEIESKINKLENSKNEIYNKLDDISSTAAPSSKTAVAYNSLEITNSKFVPVIFTPFIDFKTTYLSSKLSTLEETVCEIEYEFTDVAQNVTKTVANITAKPTLWPVNGNVSSEFGYRSDPLNSKSAFHTGIDIRVPVGTPVKASASGRVKTATYSPSYGYMVEIVHGNGFVTLYAHNSSLDVNPGDMVQQGDIISHSGNTGRVTGPHVHFEIKLNGELQNPRDYLE